MLYFDSAGSFPLLNAAKAELINELSNNANPSSGHECGMRAAQKVENVREQIADSIGAYPSEIIFTSGATESNNLALKSLLFDNTLKHIITSSIEHKCVLSILNYLQSLGVEVTYLRPTKNGVISPESVENAIKSSTDMVSLMHVNNELGSVTLIDEIGDICFKNGILFHSDAAQSYGKIPIDVDDCNLDMLSISAHKIGGAKGIGAIYMRDARLRQITPVIHGAGQEQGLRGGTIASPLVAAFGAAACHFPGMYRKANFQQLKKHLIEQLSSHNVNFKINGNEGLPHIVSLTLPKIDITSFIQSTRNEFCLAQGSACSSKEIEPSYVLTNIGLNRFEAERTIRMSFDFDISEEGISKFVQSLVDFSSS
ncbi:MAG: aminotransferase [Gammaproteobacteria bacterium TMED95]|nr:MAG: aminotransferase [Gammaproteobacteria bacterium TMED95]|tara:strand:- start:1204 stop:2310 length:1107 start_codon:yes stop_codon:yes gene_type:complete